MSTVRLAERHDAPEIARLLTALGHEASAADVADRWKAWHDEGNVAFVVEAFDGGLAGVITLHRMHVLHRPRPVGRITALIVDADARGAGLGRTLVAAAEGWASAAGCGLLELTSNDRLEPAHRFYEHLGFERTSVRLVKRLER